MSKTCISDTEHCRNLACLSLEVLVGLLFGTLLQDSSRKLRRHEFTILTCEGHVHRSPGAARVFVSPTRCPQWTVKAFGESYTEVQSLSHICLRHRRQGATGAMWRHGKNSVVLLLPEFLVTFNFFLLKRVAGARNKEQLPPMQ